MAMLDGRLVFIPICLSSFQYSSKAYAFAFFFIEVIKLRT